MLTVGLLATVMFLRQPDEAGMGRGHDAAAAGSDQPFAQYAAKFRSETRDSAWADAAERAVRRDFDRNMGVKKRKVTYTVQCAATVCEVSGYLSKSLQRGGERETEFPYPKLNGYRLLGASWKKDHSGPKGTKFIGYIVWEAATS